MFGSNKLISTNRLDHPIGTILRDQIGTTPIMFTVISANTSFIGTTLTILNPISLNGTRIRCNEDTLPLIITFGKLPVIVVVVGGKKSRKRLSFSCAIQVFLLALILYIGNGL